MLDCTFDVREVLSKQFFFLILNCLFLTKATLWLAACLHLHMHPQQPIRPLLVYAGSSFAGSGRQISPTRQCQLTFSAWRGAMCMEFPSLWAFGCLMCVWFFAAYIIHWKGERIPVFRPNVACTNGVIHVIDAPFLQDGDVQVSKAAALDFAGHLMMVMAAKWLLL